jgi:hypothetical protein
MGAYMIGYYYSSIDFFAPKIAACSAQDSRNVISHFHFENLNGQREHLIFIPIYLSEGIKHIRDRNENKEVGISRKIRKWVYLNGIYTG